MARRIVLIDIGQGLSLSGVLPAAVLYGEYSARVTARGGVPPYTYSLDAGEDPLEAAGFALDPSTGYLRSSSVEVAGRIPLTVRATDITGAFVTRQYVLQVMAEPLALTGAFADATAGVPYSSDLQISGGRPPYSAPRLLSGAIPAGLALSIAGVQLRLSGTPSGAAGDYDMVVAVDDSVGVTTQRQQQIHLSEDSQEAQYRYWRYLQVASTDAADYSGAVVDDSAWPIGAAPFGGSLDGRTSYDDPAAFDPRFAVDFATPWDPLTRLWIRRTLTLGHVPALGYRMTSFIEDNCHVYVNGTLVFDSPDRPFGGSGYKTHVPPGVFIVGENHLAVRCDDEPSVVDNSITYADFILDPATEVDVVTSLLLFDGEAGSAEFVDETGLAWSAFGNAALAVDTGAPGGVSGTFDGSGDYIQAVQSTSGNYGLGTGDFTVEAICVPAAGCDGGLFGYSTTSSYEARCLIRVYPGSTSDKLSVHGSLQTGTGNGQTCTAIDVLNVGERAHVAFVRNAGILRVFVGGHMVMERTDYVGSVLNVNKTTIRAGHIYTGNANKYFKGLIAAARITKGIARYTGDYVPPTTFEYP